MQEDEKLNRSIPFTDFSNKMLNRISNAFQTRDLLHDVCIQVQDHCSKELTADGAKKAKKQFDLICNYSKRQTDDVPNTGEMYDNDLCLFLMSKTFKKSSNDAYESFYYIHDIIENLGILESSTIKIASLGGGPGSDIVGVVGYLCDRFSKNVIANKDLNLTVYDIMD